ncbi:MAG: PepSY-associated TM helix domain-containing protein [Pseudomonadota bacterium]
MIGTTLRAFKPSPMAVNRLVRVTHIYSAAAVLLLMLFFAVTGLYLNHPDFSEGDVSTRLRDLSLPHWASEDRDETGPPPALVLRLLQWLDDVHDIAGIDMAVEYDDLDDVLVIDLANPDGTTLVEVLFEEGVAAVDQRQLSLLAKLNNLHRAKHVHGFWRFLSDFSAICMVIFSVSGLWMMVKNRRERQKTSLVLLAGCSMFIAVAFFLH